jgi:hypothetical protein
MGNLIPGATLITGAGDGARLMVLVLRDDAKREYAYGPAQASRHQGRHLHAGALQ